MRTYFALSFHLIVKSKVHFIPVIGKIAEAEANYKYAFMAEWLFFAITICGWGIRKKPRFIPVSEYKNKRPF